MKSLLKILIAVPALLAGAGCERMIDPPPFIMEELPPTPPPGPIKPVGALANPERGYHLEYAYYANKTLVDKVTDDQTQTSFNIPDLVGKWGYESSSRLIQLYIYLKAWSGTDLPQTALDNIQKAFDIVRANGFKAILRFAYNDSMYTDTGLDNPPAPRTAEAAA